jgi:hypothetical protein|tara:strand:+ start:94 stop:648 length:555 start_codon:yes stop_codon:yes gene_type:complete
MALTKEEKQKKWIKECWDYHSQYIDECDVAPDWGDWETDWNMCWCCGHRTSRLQKCHLTPKSLGGSNKASNLVPLCAQCHDQAPDVVDPQVMIDWIKDNKNPLSDFGQGRYNHLWDLLVIEYQNGNIDAAKYDDHIFKFYLTRNYEKVSAHASQRGGGIMIKPSTREWVIKQTLKDCEMWTGLT